MVSVTTCPLWDPVQAMPSLGPHFMLCQWAWEFLPQDLWRGSRRR